MLRSTYIGYPRSIGDILEGLTKQPCSEEVKRCIVGACEQLKRILLSDHQTTLAKLKSQASQSFLGKNKQIQEWFVQREIGASMVKHEVDTMSLAIQEIISKHSSIPKMLPGALLWLSLEGKMRYLVLMFCVLNDMCDLTILGLTREDCALIRKVSLVCEEYHQKKIMELFYGDFELFFNLGVALEKYDECFVYAGLWHCQHIADALELTYGGSVIDQAGYYDVSNLADIGDKFLPISSLQSL